MGNNHNNRSGNTENPGDAGAEQEDAQSPEFGTRQAPSRASLDKPVGDDAVSNPVIINR